MPADTTAKILRVLDLTLEFFADNNHWREVIITIGMAATVLSARSFISVRSMGSHARLYCPFSRRHCPVGRSG